MELKDKITVGEKYKPAMSITDQAEADAYFELLVLHCMKRWHKTRAEAERLERGNLGYYAGYFDADTRARVETLFKCSHPFFGAIEQNGQPTPREILDCVTKHAISK